MSMDPLPPGTETEVMRDQFAISRKLLLEMTEVLNGLSADPAGNIPVIEGFKDVAEVPLVDCQFNNGPEKVSASP